MKQNPYLFNSSRYSTHQLIISFIGNDKTVLDVGCNEGYIGEHAAQSNIFYGIDSNSKAIIRAKRIYRNAEMLDLNNFDKLPWSISFDLIIFADILEHLIDPDRVLKLLTARYLKPGGRVIISLPNVANWKVRLSLLMGKFDYTEVGILDKTHLHLYTFKSALKLIDSAGLKVLKIFGGSSYFFWIIMVLPFLRCFFAHSIVIVAAK